MGRHHTAVPDPVWDQAIDEDEGPPPWYIEAAQLLGDPTGRDPLSPESLAKMAEELAAAKAAKAAKLDEKPPAEELITAPAAEAEPVENEPAPKPKPRPRKTAARKQVAAAAKGGRAS